MEEEKPIITGPLVVSGLRFIAENQELPYQELVLGLRDLGCNFTLDDVKKQFPNLGTIKLGDSMAAGAIFGGATIIANVMISEANMKGIKEYYYKIDGDSSIYNFIRLATGDMNYTKANIDAGMFKGKSM